MGACYISLNSMRVICHRYEGFVYALATWAHDDIPVLGKLHWSVIR